MFSRLLPRFLCDMRVYVHSCRNIGMAQDVLDQLYVHTGFAQSGGKGMSQVVTTKVWEQNRWILAL